MPCHAMPYHAMKAFMHVLSFHMCNLLGYSVVLYIQGITTKITSKKIRWLKLGWQYKKYTNKKGSRLEIIRYMIHPYCYLSNGIISVKSSRDVRCTLLSLVYSIILVLYFFLYCHPYFNHIFFEMFFKLVIVLFCVILG